MKKIISFALAALLLVSAVPTVSATNNYDQGTQVVYEATGNEAYTITVPAKLAPGGSGTVTLSGTWADNRIVTVTADPTVTLTNSIKADDQKVLDISFDGISEAGSNTGSQTFTKGISVDGITDALFGTWSGKFNYNVTLLTNLWNSEWTYGKYLAANTLGTDTSGSACADFFELTPGKSYALQCKFNENEARKLMIFHYNADKEKIDSESTAQSVNNTWIFTVPNNENIAFTRLGFWRGGGTEDNLLPVKTTLYSVDELRSSGYTLAGQSILAFGDSITAYSTNENYSYAFQIADKNYMNIVNKGIGGATMAIHEGSSNNILAQVTAADNSLTPSIIFLNGITNDLNQTDETGEISEGFDAELDTSTFCGGFEATIKAIKEKWPSAKIIYVTTHAMKPMSQGHKTWTNLAIEMCEKWDIDVADVYNDSGFDSSESSPYTSDNIHPTTLGYKTFYVPIIESKIKELVN